MEVFYPARFPPGGSTSTRGENGLLVDNFLDQLVGMGKLDSEGSFSLDPVRARVLLEKYRLPSAVYFMLHAVSAAVASRAGIVKIELRADSLTVDFDGQPFSPDDADDCFSKLWSKDRDPQTARLQELAIARGAAEQWGSTHFSICSTEAGETRLQVCKSTLGNRLKRLLGSAGYSRELELLRDHLVSSPHCSISLNGRQLPAISAPKEVQAVYLWRRKSLPHEIAVEQPSTLMDPVDNSTVNTAEGLVCRLLPGDRLTGGDPRTYWPGFLDLLVNGRLYRYRLPADVRGYWGIFWSSGLHRDLSHTNILQSEVEEFVDLVRGIESH